MRRTYRRRMSGEGLKYVSVQVEQTDVRVAISAQHWQSNMSKLIATEIKRVRRQITDWIDRDPDFEASLEPYRVHDAPDIICQMACAGQITGVGPMAAVAGAVAEYVGMQIARELPRADVIVENGGDVWMRIFTPRIIRLHAPTMPALAHLGLKIDPDHSPIAVCTSSGTVGPSLSLGCAHAVTVVASDACLADAAATAGGNRIVSEDDVPGAVQWLTRLTGITGAVAGGGDNIAIQGELELVNIGK